ncbi:uncharacterized protein FYW47_000170 [Aplochiton taeniatus]
MSKLMPRRFGLWIQFGCWCAGLQRDRISVGTINVTFIGNTSFRVSWLDDLVQNYSCFSVEWRRRGQRATYRSFYESQNKYKDIDLEEPLKPFTRYIFTLFSRSNKPPCNLKHLNNSESTYGSVQAYFAQGAPIQAPSNILSSNVTQSSMVLEWSALSEEHLRGFLQGYLIRYVEIPPTGSAVENAKDSTNITVGPHLTRHELVSLKSGAVYQVQMSAFTSAGVEVWSSSAYFQTKSPGGTIAGIVLLALSLMGPVSIQRSGEEENSSQILYVLESTTQTAPRFSWFPESSLPDTEPEKHHDSDALSAGPCCGDQSQGGLASTAQGTDTKEKPSSEPVCMATPHTGPKPDQAAGLLGGSFIFHSDYTTMERFQQLLPLCPSERPSLGNRVPEAPLEETDSTFTQMELQFMCQCSTNEAESQGEHNTFL